MAKVGNKGAYAVYCLAMLKGYCLQAFHGAPAVMAIRQKLETDNSLTQKEEDYESEFTGKNS